MPNAFLFTSESVSEGHPDKVCDTIADAILDAYLAQDPQSRVACEVLAKNNQVVLAGEVSSSAVVPHEAIVRRAVRNIGYDDPSEPFAADTVKVTDWIAPQAAEIRRGVDRGAPLEQGAGDQGIMFGYATDETPERLPLPIVLAHRITKTLADDRKSGSVAWLRPDAKSQLSVRFKDGSPESVSTVVVSTQHAAHVSHAAIIDFVRSSLLPRALGSWFNEGLEILVNPTGSFVQGGPSADCGVTGRKIIVDTYGGFARHGGGAFSGKDPSKVDRSGAYAARFIAKAIVDAGLARRAELQVSYAIGRPEPVSVLVDTFGTGDADAAEAFAREFDLRPGAIIERLDLLRPIYSSTTNYGHFGKPNLPWEVTP